MPALIAVKPFSFRVIFGDVFGCDGLTEIFGVESVF